MTDLVHIGFPKTGTTFLQSHFFATLAHRAFVTHWGEGSEVFRPLAENLYYAEDDEYLEETISAYLAETRRRGEGDLVWSDENLSGAVFARGYNWQRNAERVHRQLPEARILIIVRDQATMLRSLYSLYVQKGGYARFSDFVENRAVGCDFDPDHLCYDRVVAHYRALFGPEKVDVLPYELLAADTNEFFAQISRIIGGGAETATERRLPKQDNRSLSPVSRWLLRQSNRMFARSNLNPRPLIRAVPGSRRHARWSLKRLDARLFPNADQRLGRADSAALLRVLERYGESNVRLERLTGLPVSTLGYPGLRTHAGAGHSADETVVSAVRAASR